MDKYYNLSIADKRGALHFKSLERQDFHNLFWGNHENFNFPIKLEKLQGSKPYDFIQCAAASFILISETVYQLLKNEGITGWDTYLVELPSSIEFNQKYFGLSIIGRSGAIDDTRSIKTKMPPRMPNAPEYYSYMGLYFDEKTHDGSDLFSPTGTTHIFTNTRVKTLFEKQKITNCYFRTQDDLENFNVKLKNGV